MPPCFPSPTRSLSLPLISASLAAASTTCPINQTRRLGISIAFSLFFRFHNLAMVTECSGFPFHISVEVSPLALSLPQLKLSSVDN